MTGKLASLLKMRNRFFISFFSQNTVNHLLKVESVFMTSFILFLGLEEWQIGTIASIIGLTGMLGGFVPLIYNRFKSRRKAVIIFKCIQYSIVYVVMVVPLMKTGELKFISLLISLFIFHGINAINNIAILEWTNKYVPIEIRSQYFSTRNMIFNIIGMIAPFTLGKILTPYGGLYITYVVIAACFLVFMIIDIVNMKTLEDCVNTKQNVSVKEFVQDMRKVFLDKSYMHFLIFNMLWTFALFFGNGYYTYYAVKYQNLSLGFIGLVGSGTAMIKTLIARKCGKTVDEHGWEKIFYKAGLGFSVISLLWIFLGVAPRVIYPIIIFLKGIFMITFNISKFQVNLALSKEKYRMFYLSVNGCFVGLINFVSNNFVSGLVKVKSGGFLSELSEVLGVDVYIMIFVMSGFLHMLSLLYFYTFHREKKCDMMGTN